MMGTFGSDTTTARLYQNGEAKIAFLGEGTQLWVSESTGTLEPPYKTLYSSLDTNYDFYNAILNTKYSDIVPFSNPAQSVPKASLLMLKGLLVPENAITYSFKNNNGIQGFEFVSSATSSSITFFTPSDFQYELIIKNLSREQIDHVLESLKED